MNVVTQIKLPKNVWKKLLINQTMCHRPEQVITRRLVLLAFLHTGGRQHRNHRLWSDVTNHGTLFHLEQYLCKLWKLLMRFSRRFLWMKEENQHFPQMTIIWHKIRHFHTTKSIWRRNKIINVSKRFVYHMSKLGSWRFGYAKIDQYLLLEPSIDKQRELSCARNIKY